MLSGNTSIQLQRPILYLETINTLVGFVSSTESFKATNYLVRLHFLSADVFLTEAKKVPELLDFPPGLLPLIHGYVYVHVTLKLLRPEVGEIPMANFSNFADITNGVI